MDCHVYAVISAGSKSDRVNESARKNIGEVMNCVDMLVIEGPTAELLPVSRCGCDRFLHVI